jgi:DnaJ-class molecular chaperone
MPENGDRVARPELESKCSHCDGEGIVYEWHPKDSTPCSDCDGTGYILTELGRTVLDLMDHQFKKMLHKHFRVG